MTSGFVYRIGSMDIQADFQFSRDQVTGIAAQLRYVTSINADLTQVQFVAEAVKAGYNKQTAAIQFRNSRTQWVADCDDCVLMPDGRLVEKAPA